MNLDLSEEQLMLRESARDFLTAQMPKKLVRQLEDSEAGYSPELWRQIAALGWTGLVLPEEYGGSGMSFLDLAMLLEEMGRACLPGPFIGTVVLGALPILRLGTDAQKQRYLPAIARGDLTFSLALTEESGRYRADAIRLKGVSEGDWFVLTGRKVYVPYAQTANFLLCVARTGIGPVAEDGLTLLIVDAQSAGLSFTPLNTIWQDKQCEVGFERVRVPRENVLGEPDKAWPAVAQLIEHGAVATCCDITGCLRQAFEMTLTYAKDRVAFGQPIGSFQAVQHHCANMATDVYGTMLATYQAASKISECRPCAWEVAVAKAWASRASPRVMALAHQIHGAIGITMDHDLHYYTRRTKAAEAAFGDADFYQWLVARDLAH